MEKIKNAVEKHRKLILDAERYIWAHPETGYRETVTSNYMAEKFRELGYELTMAEGITGFYTVIDTKKEGPEIMVLGEMDSIICPAHKDADPKTGAVHSCGHNAQCAALLGIAAALKEKGALDGLCGRIRLVAVPAEELLEIGYRTNLKAEGKIKYLGGKTEFLHRGYFDGVDIAFMVHTSTHYNVTRGNVGCITKKIAYKGTAAHAGGSPWLGKNALYAANCGINAINAIRETFKEADIIRVHPIITRGGDMVNAIPEEVTLESYVRGSSFDAIIAANKNVNRALTGAALSIGTNIEIIDAPGYGPLHNDKGMIELCQEAFDAMFPGEKFVVHPAMSSGSTDVGDLSALMPVVQPYAGGACGKSHGNDYEIVDAEEACVKNAMWQINMLHMLLTDNAVRAKKIIEDFKPLYESKEAYLAFIDSLDTSGDRIEYHADGTASVRCD